MAITGAAWPGVQHGLCRRLAAATAVTVPPAGHRRPGPAAAELGGGATGDGDYIAKTGTLTFARGETTKSITIEVKGDSKNEANETFYLDLFGNSGNSLFTKNRGLSTILNHD